jgi:hypothetical protein
MIPEPTTAARRSAVPTASAAKRRESDGVLLSFTVDTSESADERLEAAKALRVDAVAGPRAIDLALDEARLLEDLEVLRDGGLGQWELVHDLAADTRASSCEKADDLHSRRVSEGLRHCGELVVGSGPLNGPQIGSLRGRRATFLCDLWNTSSDHIVTQR